MATFVVAGGTGLLGTALVGALRQEGRSVVVLTRHPKRDHEVRWSPGSRDESWTSVLDGAEAVINLAGVSIAGGRWTTARKAAILDSRIEATGALVTRDHRGTTATARLHQQLRCGILRNERRRTSDRVQRGRLRLPGAGGRNCGRPPPAGRHSILASCCSGVASCSHEMEAHFPSWHCRSNSSPAVLQGADVNSSPGFTCTTGLRW